MRGHFLTKTLFRGIGVVVPLALSLYILIWVVGGIESVLHDLLAYVLPPGYYVPGMGFALLLLIIFFAGLLMYPWLTRSLVTRTDDMLREIPLFGSIYSPIKDFAKLFGGDIQQELGQPVMVTIPGSGMEMLGFITREDGKGLPEGFLPDDHVVVFVQHAAWRLLFHRPPRADPGGGHACRGGHALGSECRAIGAKRVRRRAITALKGIILPV